MGQFDQTARPLAKTDGAAFFNWALSCCPPAPHLTFLQWDDTRRLVVPGESERTNDLVATFRDEDTQRPVWLIAEIETEPEVGILYRMGQYELLLGKEVNPSCDPDGPAVGSLVLNLSGTQKTPRLEWAWGAYGTRLAPFLVDAAQKDALAHLEKIGRTTWLGHFQLALIFFEERRFPVVLQPARGRSGATRLNRLGRGDSGSGHWHPPAAVARTSPAPHRSTDRRANCRMLSACLLRSRTSRCRLTR